MRSVWVGVCASSLLAVAALPARASEAEEALRTLPAPVQQAVKAEQGQGASLRSIAKEVTDGVTVYEAEMLLGGRRRDILFDVDGRIVSLEEEKTLGEIPAGARASIQRAVGTGKLALVEKVTKGGVTFYEGHIRSGEQLTEVKVDAEGKPVQ